MNEPATWDARYPEHGVHPAAVDNHLAVRCVIRPVHNPNCHRQVRGGEHIVDAVVLTPKVGRLTASTNHVWVAVQLRRCRAADVIEASRGVVKGGGAVCRRRRCHECVSGRRARVARAQRLAADDVAAG